MHISNDIRYVGVNDHEIDLFEGQYDVPNGMAYNSYVILDEKIAVMDTVDARFASLWLGNVQAVLEEQLAKQSQETTEKVSQLMEQKKSGKGILPVCILTFAAVLVNITIVVLQLLGIF